MLCTVNGLVDATTKVELAYFNIHIVQQSYCPHMQNLVSDLEIVLCTSLLGQWPFEKGHPSAFSLNP